MIVCLQSPGRKYTVVHRATEVASFTTETEFLFRCYCPKMTPPPDYNSKKANTTPRDKDKRDKGLIVRQSRANEESAVLFFRWKYFFCTLRRRPSMACIKYENCCISRLSWRSLVSHRLASKKKHWIPSCRSKAFSSWAYQIFTASALSPHF